MMKLITLHLPIPYIKMLDELMKVYKLYPNRNEAIRFAVRDMLTNHSRHVDIKGFKDA